MVLTSSLCTMGEVPIFGSSLTGSEKAAALLENKVWLKDHLHHVLSGRKCNGNGRGLGPGEKQVASMPSHWDIL